MKKSLSVVILAVLALSMSAFASGPGLSSAQQSVTLNAQLSESISVVSNNPTVNFVLQPGQSSLGDAPMSFTTNWTLGQAVRMSIWTPILRIPRRLSSDRQAEHLR